MKQEIGSDYEQGQSWKICWLVCSCINSISITVPKSNSTSKISFPLEMINKTLFSESSF